MDFVVTLAIPHRPDVPTAPSESHDMAAVELTVLLKFREHDLGPQMTCGRDMAIRVQMPVPQAVAKEDDLPSMFEDELWAAGQALNSGSAGVAEVRHNGTDALVRVGHLHDRDLSAWDAIRRRLVRLVPFRLPG